MPMAAILNDCAFVIPALRIGISTKRQDKYPNKNETVSIPI